MNKRVYLDSIGCRLNQSEIASMSRQFQQIGYQVVENPAEADLFVVNTCAVTSAAGKDSRKMIRKLHRHNQDAEIAVTGCYAHLAASTVAALPGVAHVLDNVEKEKLVPMVTGEAYDIEPIQRHFTPGTAGLTRSFVKVQDGCENKCTFCITTVARGPGRSRPLEEILREVQMMTAGGYQEVVLTGVHLGSYGHDFGETSGLRELVHALLNATDMPRIRLSSLEPWDIAEDFFQLWENPRLCRHLHLPLQSGCDRTLKRMLRNTDQANFRALVNSARAQIPGVAISTDLIVGFPGEDEDEFAESYAFTQEMDFMKIHVFPYSRREGTAAARMKNHIGKATQKDRVHQIQALSDEGAERFAARFIGDELPVLWEGIRGASEAGFWHTGLTDNYIRVEMSYPQVISNTITTTHLSAQHNDVIRGELLN
jgi:threonylcarbamoyladenosine tRNA methylthiotransferase MtaB